MQYASRIKNALRRRWVHRSNNRRIRLLAAQIGRNATVEPEISPVVLFNASTRLGGLSLNAAFSMLTGWSLRLAGTPVVHFVCESGMSQCVLGTQIDKPAALPPCEECIAQSKQTFTGSDVRWFHYQLNPDLEEALQSLNLGQLMEYQHQGIPLGKLVVPSLRWVLRRHHLMDDEATRYLARQYLLSAWGIANEFNALLEDQDPQAVVVFNGMFYPEATARYIAQIHRKRVITHEVGLQPFSAFFTNGEATAYPIDIPPDYDLNPEQEARLDSYLKQRFKGNFSMAGIRFWPQMQSLDPEFLQQAKGYQQIVSVFTNVVFDTSQDHANVVFPHMFAWLDLILEIMKEYPETYFVIRAHPDERRPGKESMESVANWVDFNQVESMPNVLFVDSQEYFSSYELIQRSKFVMVYNSTVGLEASLLSAAVLCGGKARYTQLETVFFPKTPEAYRKQAQAFLEADGINVPIELSNNARRFLYYQLFVTSLPFGDFLREDGVWHGYVNLKLLTWRNLLPANSDTMCIIVNGILEDKPFLFDETSVRMED